MQYFQKYIKYKKKYLATKQRQSGGGEARLDPQVQKFVDSLPTYQPLSAGTVDEARDGLEKLQEHKFEDLPPEIRNTIEEQKIDMEYKEDTRFNFSIYILRPKEMKGKSPTVLYVHGGGWVLGSKNTHDRLIREICHYAQVTVVFVEYTRSPDASYPIALNQCYQTLTYIVGLADKYDLDINRLAIVGDSVGGNMSAVLCMMAKDKGGPRIAFQGLLYPVTSAKMDTESFKLFANGPWLTAENMAWFWRQYGAYDLSNRYVSPLEATKEQLKFLPPALVIVDENDVLRDEGEMYAHNLMDAGVETVAVRVLGSIHDFCMLKDLRNTKPTRIAMDILISQLRKYLS